MSPCYVVIYDSGEVARLAGWAVLAWLAARAKRHKVEIPAIDWHVTRGTVWVGGCRGAAWVFVCVSVYLLGIAAQSETGRQRRLEPLSLYLLC